MFCLFFYYQYYHNLLQPLFSGLHVVQEGLDKLNSTMAIIGPAVLTVCLKERTNQQSYQVKVEKMLQKGLLTLEIS